MVGGPQLYLAGLLEEICKRFRKDPNVNIRNKISLSKDVSSSDKKWLTREITTNEVWIVVKQIGPLILQSRMICTLFSTKSAEMWSLRKFIV